MKLPQQLPWEASRTQWASLLEPIVFNPANDSLILKNVVLAVGTNIIPHKLGRKLQGWKTTRIRGTAVSLYDLQDSNQTPVLTLALVSDAVVTIDLEVF